MTPLDLTAGPPRSPRAELDGVVFLPRTIDKVRALSGGNLGEYTIPGFTQMMLDTLGIPLEAFTAAVAVASSTSGSSGPTSAFLLQVKCVTGRSCDTPSMKMSTLSFRNAMRPAIGVIAPVVNVYIHATSWTFVSSTVADQ